MNNLIDREDAIEEIVRRDTTDGNVKVYGGREIIDILKSLPVIKLGRKEGKWILLDGYRCSVCNYKLQTTGIPIYCPNCGADMGVKNG